MSEIFRNSDELTNALTEHIKSLLAAEVETNADRIRSMSDEELADYLSAVSEESVRGRTPISSTEFEIWLKAPAVEDKNEQQE